MLLAGVALVMTGNGLIAPVLSLYAADFVDSSLLVGLAISLFGLGRLVLNIPSGLAAQHFPARTILFIGAGILTAGSFGTALADELFTLLIWRMVQGFGAGIFMTVSMIVLARLATDDNRGRLLALYQFALLTGSVVGPVFGGWLAEYLNRSAPFLAYAYACLIVIGFIVLFMTEPPIAAHEQAGNGRTGLAALLRHPATMAVCILNFAVFSARSSAQWVGLPLLVGAIYDLSVIGLALGLIAVTNLVALPFADKVIKRFGSGPASIYAGLATAAGLFMLALGADFVWFWSSLFVLGASAAIGATALTVHLVEAVQSSGLGPALGLYRTSGDLGYVAGPVIIGILSDSLGLVVSQEIMLSMAVMLAATLAFALLAPNTKRLNAAGGERR